MTIIIPSLAIAGYRSFGPALQYFEHLAKINILIGQNNSGKSNILRFIQEVYPTAGGREPLRLDPLARHLPKKPPMLIGIGETSANTNRFVAQLEGEGKLLLVLMDKLFKAKAAHDKTELCWSIITLPERKVTHDTWQHAVKTLNDREIEQLWQILTGMRGGDRQGSWEPKVIEYVPANLRSIPIQTIPAIRRIGSKGSSSEGFDGTGIIERLAKLQNPDVHNQASRERFAAITRFLREVTDRPDASIEIPYERDTILVHMDDKVLPIDSLGSGIHEVLILAAAATVLADHVVCIEEPELHLNPILQRKLIRYLQAETSNQYFITTHSAALMDAPDAEIYHVRLNAGYSLVERVTTDTHRSAVCADLGYHPSDLLQANCVIWVEGPSDRIYLNWWLRAIEPSLVEGIHYSVMFYGGRLAAHLSNSPDDCEVEDFISLRRLNRRGVMLMDSDRSGPHQPINATKRRLQAEFDAGPGHTWITEGREIENYLPKSQVKAALDSVCPAAKLSSPFGRYDSVLLIKRPKGKEGQAPKVEIARYITANFMPDLTPFNLRQRLEKLRRFIQDSNPNLR